MSEKLNQDIKYLPTVGPKKSELMHKEIGVKTFMDLLYYFPYRYIDRTKFYKIAEINEELPYIQIKGKIVKYEMLGEKSAKRLVAIFTDGERQMELIWFKGHKWIMQSLNIHSEYVIFGKPAVFNGKLNMVHPEMEEAQKAESMPTFSNLHPQYNTTEKLKSGFVNSRYIQRLVAYLVKNFINEIEESLPPHLIEKQKLIPLKEALFNIHFPQGNEELKKAEYRIKFEELFYIQLRLLFKKSNREQTVKGLQFSTVGNFFNTFYKEYLPFELTDAQKRVIKEIRKDTGSGKQMNRLVQGDVGSGKTMVAIMVMLIAADNGYQSCLMAPTEILAQQHYANFKRLLGQLGLNIQILTGNTLKSERPKIFENLKNGITHILIGTHALIEDNVIFQNLGMAVIDEQHRFGVAQRAQLRYKNVHPPHILVMTATPIPRTLAMTVYGDLDVSVIDQLPPGRKPIRTLHYFENKRNDAYQLMRDQIKLGRQVYIVYPLISESEKMDYKALEEGYKQVCEIFKEPAYKVSMVHGKMKKQEKEDNMSRFIKKETHIMVATTVIEVGVDVPNASVMLIESAERFGLSQLHQLRGRVGRGADQSYCILLSSPKLSNDGRKRLQTMVRTNDGFEIAETDLKLRGPGDVEGTMQSGMPFDLKLAELTKDQQILMYSRDIASELLSEDPLLEDPKNNILRQTIIKKQLDDTNWKLIG